MQVIYSLKWLIIKILGIKFVWFVWSDDLCGDVSFNSVCLMCSWCGN